MAEDLKNLTNEQLLEMAGISAAPAGAPPTPATNQPRQIIGAASPKPDSPPPGYRVNASGNYEYIPGGPADPNIKKPQPTALELRAELNSIQSIRDQIKDSLQYVRPGTTSIGAYTGQLGGVSSFLFPDAAVLNSRIEELAGKQTLDYLSGLKQRTEGTPLAGATSDKDVNLARQAAGNIAQTSRDDELRRNLLRYDNALENLQLKLQGKESKPFNAYLKDYSKQEVAAPKVGEVATEVGAEAVRTDPALAGTNAKVRSMLKAGVPQNVIVDYLNSVRPGLGDGAVPSLNAVERWKAANPNYKGGFRVDLEKEYYKTSAVESAIGKIAKSAPGAYAIQAANTLALGGLPQLTARPEETSAIIAGLGETQPTASTLGQISGALIGAAGPSMALRAAGATPGLAGIGGDIAFGAGTGAVSAGEDNRLSGAAAGAGLSLLGAGLGSGLTKLASNAVSPVVSREVREAAKAEVPMSLGTMLGGGYKSFEERLANVIPFFDTKLQGISDEAASTAQRKVFDEVLQPIGKKLPNDVGIGEEAFKHLDNVYAKEYSNLYAQMRFSRTPDVDQKIADLVNDVQNRPGLTQDEVSQFSRELTNNVIGPITRRKGYLTGEEFGKVMSNLKTAKRAAYKKSDELGSAINDLQAILEDGAVAATQSKAVGERYRNLSDSYRKFLIVQSAAKKPTGELGEFTGGQLRPVAATAEGGRATTTGEGPLTNLARMMQIVTPAGASGSSTMRNAAIGGLIGAGGLAAYSPENLGPVGALTGAAALPFLLGSSRRLNPAMRALVTTERPQAVQSLANITRNALAPLSAAYGRQTLLDQYSQSQEQERLRRLAMGQ